MNDKIIKILTTTFFLLLILSFMRTYYCTNIYTAYFFDVPSVILTLLGGLGSIYLYTKKNPKWLNVASFFLALSYFVTLNVIYSSNCKDSYQVLFLWIKELIISFIVIASYYLSIIVSGEKSTLKVSNAMQAIIHFASIFVFLSLLVDKIVSIKSGLMFYLASAIPFTLLMLEGRVNRR